MSATELSNTRVLHREEAALPADVQRQLLRAIANIEYGSVEVVIHDSRVVQIEAREKIRFANTARPRSTVP